MLILLKPPTSSVKFARLSSKGHHIQRRTIGSFEYKLSSFYTYLTALSFCDFFSCIFNILNVLEYIPPPYQNNYSMKYREICLSISLYTHPIGKLILFVYKFTIIKPKEGMIKPVRLIYAIHLDRRGGCQKLFDPRKGQS